MGKYEPLQQFLMSTDVGSRRMSFGEIERTLGFKLPKSAYEHEAWWSNNATGHSHARAWLNIGWRTEAVDLNARKVTFQRSPEMHVEAVDGPGDPWGCMRGTITIAHGRDLTAPSGEMWDAEEGKLVNE